MHFKKEYENIYDDLIECGICHTDPAEAAEFVNKIKDFPEIWWFSEKTRIAREKFLRSNIGDPKILIDHLLFKII